jgi:FkbM family methyltransferase
MLREALAVFRRVALCRQCFGSVRGLAVALTERVPGVSGRRLGALSFGRAPVFLRAGTNDLEVYRDVVLQNDYELPLDSSPSVIVDAGAHIGLASIWFATKYPSASIIALEPEAGNYDTLVRNTASYPNIRPVRAALWGASAEMDVIDSGDGTWGFRVEQGAAEGGTSSLTGVTVTEVMQQFDVEHIDLLKVDIEGAEVEVFSDCGAWIERVDRVVIELHDRFRPGCSRTFFAAVKDFSEESWIGENVLVAR